MGGFFLYNITNSFESAVIEAQVRRQQVPTRLEDLTREQRNMISFRHGGIRAYGEIHTHWDQTYAGLLFSPLDIAGISRQPEGYMAFLANYDGTLWVTIADGRGGIADPVQLDHRVRVQHPPQTQRNNEGRNNTCVP